MCEVSIIFCVATSLAICFQLQDLVSSVFQSYTKLPLANHQKTSHVVIRQFLSSYEEKKKGLHHIWLCSASKTPILSKCQPTCAGLRQRSYLYLETGHCYCAAPHKAHTTYGKQANAINNMGAIHRWNAGRGWIQPDLEDTLPIGYLQSHRWPVCMPACDTQTPVKGSRETIEMYTSQPLCLYQDPTLIF